MIVSIAQNISICRNDSQKMSETSGDVLQVPENVSVIEFQVVQTRTRAIVNEFASLVEKGGVVFIPLDHKGGLTSPISLPLGKSKGTPPTR